MGDAAEPGEMEQTGTGTGTNTSHCNGKFPQIDKVVKSNDIVLISSRNQTLSKVSLAQRVCFEVVNRLLFVRRNVAFPSNSQPRFNLTAHPQAPQRTDTESSPNETIVQQELVQKGKMELIKRKEKSPTSPYKYYRESQCDVICDLSFFSTVANRTIVRKNSETPNDALLLFAMPKPSRYLQKFPISSRTPWRKMKCQELPFSYQKYILLLSHTHPSHYIALMHITLA